MEMDTGGLCVPRVTGSILAAQPGVNVPSSLALELLGRAPLALGEHRIAVVEESDDRHLGALAVGVAAVAVIERDVHL